MGNTAQNEYSASAMTDQFWTAPSRPPVMGDLLGRHLALELLDPKPGELILDAGCGAGYMSRLYATAGARVVGVDSNPDMLRVARAHNAEDCWQLPISYFEGDIATLNFGYGLYNAVSCVAVLFHLSREEVGSFLRAAYAALRSGGRIVLSYSSSWLMEKGSQIDLGWVRYEGPLEIDGPSKLWKEHYRNSVGQTFTSKVWGHSTEDMLRAIFEAGFWKVEWFSRVVSRSHLEWVHAEGPTGYPAFEQITAIKG